MEKCAQLKADGKNADKPKKVRIKRENADSKNTNKNKQTNTKSKEIFLSSGCHMVGWALYVTQGRFSVL